MCLGLPAKVVSVAGDIAIVDINGVKREVSCLLLPDVKEGDFVIIHAGFIISKIDEKEYIETIKVLKELAEAAFS